MKFKNDIEAQAGIKDTTGNLGSAGELLSSTGTGVEWIAQSAVSASSDFMFYEVKNSSGATINKGKAVMAVGTDGNSGHILIDELIADGSVESRYFMGVLETTVANGDLARVIAFGELDQFNTLGQNGETWADGQVLWCSPVYPGDFTITEPQGPNLKIPAAFIMKAATNGKIQIRVQGNEGIKDLYDTKITTQADGELLVWDNTTGVWMNDDTAIIDYTNGRVGIGTTSPATKLEVYTANGTESSIRIRQASQNYWDLKSPASNTSFTISDVGGERMRITSTGNVGIGTTTPSTNLHVVGNARVTGIYYDSGNNEGSAGQILSSTATGTSWISGSAIPGVPDGSGTANYLARWIVTDTLGIGVAYDNGTNVGIGTTSPNSVLDVSGAGNFLGGTVVSGIDTQTDVGVAIAKGDYIKTNDGNYLRNIIGHGATGDIEIGQGGTGLIGNITLKPGTSGDIKFFPSGSQDVTFSSSGNVGIGTTSPGAKLQIGSATFAPNGNLSNNLLQIKSSTGFAYLTIGNGDVANSTSYIGGASGLTTFGSVTDAGAITETMRIDSSGNVGIGTPSPGAKLDIHSATNSNALLIREDTDDSITHNFYIDSLDNAQTVLYANGQLATISLNTAGSSYFNGGNVGIGTTSPNEKLQVAGNIHAYEPGGINAALFASTGAGDTTVAIRSSGITHFNGGNVGIGVTTFNAGERFVVSKGSIGATSLNGLNDAVIEGSGDTGLTILSPNTNYGSIAFGDPQNGAIGRIRYQHSTNAMTFNTNGSEYMRIISNGNVGIGTTSPSAKLELSGTTGQLLVLDDSSATGNPFMSFYQAGTRRSYIQHLDASDLLNLVSEYGGIKFMTGTLGTEVDRVVIDSAGNVGINITNPTEKLAVTGNIETTESANGVKIGFNVGDSFTLNGADTAHYGLSCGSSASIPLVLSGYFGVAIATNGLERARILQSNGYFGILTPTPVYELDVTGTIRATGNVIAFSDVRVKENIKTIDSALEKVNKLRGVEFNKIGEEKTCIGVIAQEVEEVLPEVVETDDNGMKAVAYGNMVGLLIEAMKEQQKQIDELKAKLESYGS